MQQRLWVERRNGRSNGGGGTEGSPVSVLVVQNANQIDVKDMAWAQSLADETGCQIDWQRVDDNAWGQQKNPSLAAGDVPDIVIRGIGQGDAAQFPNLFVDISTKLDQLPNVARFFEEKPDARHLAENADGEIFSLTSSRGKAYDATGQHMMINKTWLDELGLAIPTTWDELETVLEAFKTQDPNGNGVADEIPMNIRPVDAGWYSPLLFLNSTGIVTSFNKGPSTSGIYVQDGVVKDWLISDGLKDVIAYYHELMSKGLIPADALTKDASAYYADQTGDGETARTGVIFGWSLADFGDMADQYVAMPVPAQDASMDPSEVVWDASDNEFEGGKLAVSVAAEDNPCVWKVVDALYSEKFSVQQFLGALGEYVEDNGNGTYTVLPAYQEALDDGQATALSDRLAGWIPDSVTIINEKNADELQEVDSVYSEQRSNFDPVLDRMPDYVTLTAAESTEVSNLNTAIQNYAWQKLSEWIMNGGVESEWDGYVKQLDGLGIEKVVEIWQTAYDQQVEK